MAEECVLCEDRPKSVLLKCGHCCFCRGCIDLYKRKMVEKGEEPVCPICRKILVVKGKFVSKKLDCEFKNPDKDFSGLRKRRHRKIIFIDKIKHRHCIYCGDYHVLCEDCSKPHCPENPNVSPCQSLELNLDSEFKLDPALDSVEGENQSLLQNIR